MKKIEYFHSFNLFIFESTFDPFAFAVVTLVWIATPNGGIRRHRCFAQKKVDPYSDHAFWYWS